MAKRGFLLLFLLLFLALWISPGLCLAMEVEEMVITTGISDRRSVDAGETFPASTGRLYCFIELSGAHPESTITHAWYWEGKEMARVELPVRSTHWRTWSSKNLLPEWTGKWEVKILGGNGEFLGAVSFNLH